jgi:hypothetical protein
MAGFSGRVRALLQGCRAFPDGLPPSSLLWEQREFHDFLPICFESASRSPAAALRPSLFRPPAHPVIFGERGRDGFPDSDLHRNIRGSHLRASAPAFGASCSTDACRARGGAAAHRAHAHPLPQLPGKPRPRRRVMRPTPFYPSPSPCACAPVRALRSHSVRAALPPLLPPSPSSLALSHAASECTCVPQGERRLRVTVHQRRWNRRIVNARAVCLGVSGSPAALSGSAPRRKREPRSAKRECASA